MRGNSINSMKKVLVTGSKGFLGRHLVKTMRVSDYELFTLEESYRSPNGKRIDISSQDLEPMVKGQQLVDILAELIDAITQQMYLTPAGPSAVGPTNISDFGSIKSKLNNILSKLNQTS